MLVKAGRHYHPQIAALARALDDTAQVQLPRPTQRGGAQTAPNKFAGTSIIFFND
jgi:hypothetical protein